MSWNEENLIPEPGLYFPPNPLPILHKCPICKNYIHLWEFEEVLPNGDSAHKDCIKEFNINQNK